MIKMRYNKVDSKTITFKSFHTGESVKAFVSLSDELNIPSSLN